MWCYKTVLVTFCLSVALLHPLPAWCQTAELKGTIWDAVAKKPVGAADVIVTDTGTPGSRLGHVITGNNGKYSIPDLKRGNQVKVRYSCEGYKPRIDVSITLSTVVITQDEVLIHDTDDPGYWAMYAQAIKTTSDKTTPNEQKRFSLYNQYWTVLATYDLSPVAQAQAARQIAKITPPASHSPQMESFAAVDLDAVRKADADIRAALNGKADLSNKYGVPLDVAAEIAASEIKASGSTASSNAEFIEKFQGVWGNGAKDTINYKLVEHPTDIRLGNINKMAMQGAGGPG
jgi:hypothetical protein